MRQVKIPSYSDKIWYILKEDGTIYREMSVLEDRKGVIRYAYEQRKLHKAIKRYPMKVKWNKDRNRYYVYLNRKGGRSEQMALHTLVAEYFCEKPDTSCPLSVHFKDGNYRNIKASNLEWRPWRDSVWVEAKRTHKPPITINTRIKYYKVPKSCPLYDEYQAYLENHEKVIDTVVVFMKREGLLSSLVKVGYNTRVKRKDDECVTIRYPYLMFRDRDDKILQHDLDILGTSARPPINSYYTLRKNSKPWHHWDDLVKSIGGIKDIPSVKDYIYLEEVARTEQGEHWKYYKSFAMEDRQLYLRIQSQHPFVVSDILIECKEDKEYLFGG